MIQFVNITKEEFLKTKILYKHLPLERFLEAKYTRKGKEVNFNWKGKVFCTCMTQTITSEAFWNTYSRGNIGIELRIYKEKLLEELSRYDDTYKITYW